MNKTKTKPFIIPKERVMQAFKLIKANAGGEGVDQQSLLDFEKDLKDNLYKLWNRLSSGSYFPPAVKAVSIPKKSGGERILGVPTVADRIAQMVIKLTLEPEVEPHFLPDSYGYRPNKSAIEAVGITRQRCWQYNWVVEYDIRGFFDNLDHELLMKAVRKHTECKWTTLYVERWLKAPLQLENGTLIERTKGVPQGGVVSPLLSNLFLHYVFDNWMIKRFSELPWCRYADDGLVHCKTEQQAQRVLAELMQRFKACGLELHPIKTKIVYCKDANRKGEYANTMFEFLGYSFRCRVVKNKQNKLFLSFNPEASPSAQKSMRAKTRAQKFHSRSDLSLNDIAKEFNPVLRGWIEYYGKYQGAAGLHPVLRHFNKTLVAWAMRKYKKFRGHKTKAGIFLQNIAKREPNLFAHWKIGMVSVFV